MKYQKHPRRDPIKNFFPLPNELFHLKLGVFANARRNTTAAIQECLCALWQLPVQRQLHDSIC